MTTKPPATERAIGLANLARRVRYGAATCRFNPGELYLDPAPHTFVAAQRAAGADDAAATRVAINPDVIAANILAARCFADVDNALRAGVAGGIWRIPKTQKATIRAIELQDAAIERLRIALDRAYAEDKKKSQDPQKLITVEDEKIYGIELIDLAKRAAADATNPDLSAFCQEYQAQCVAMGGSLPPVPALIEEITTEDKQTYGDELIDIAKRAAREALVPEINALRQEVLSQFAALGTNNARGSTSMPPTKLITLDDEQTYGKELIDLFKRAAREDVVPSLNRMTQTLLSQFAELRAGIARGTISLPDRRPSPQEGARQRSLFLLILILANLKLTKKLMTLLG